ncbi:9050_t:CDS:10 [Acaulospora colombiana]|uniref:9050_t:CDS:1 n=1 Tax=Acaulospora colombiana TaxID=27376 RepID=A0ACA9KRY0_9GLOM|nr:9050_t:CDS:10 [Acaulospora colombiana]
MSKSLYSLKAAFDDLDKFIGSKLAESERKRRGRPPKRGNSTIVKEMQKEREDFANKAFFAHRDMIPKFFRITANEFFGDTRRFLNLINEINDGMTKNPKTLKVSRMSYNQNKLHYPDGQDCFFVDFNKNTISTTIKSAEGDEAVENEVIDIKYSKISYWEIQMNAREKVLKICVSESLRLGRESPPGMKFLSMMFEPHEDHVIESIRMILANRRVKQQPRDSFPSAYKNPITGDPSKFAKASGVRASKQDNGQIDIIDLDKEITPVSTRNKFVSSKRRNAGNSPERIRDYGHNKTGPASILLNGDSDETVVNHESITQINYDTNRRHTHPPQKQRTEPLNLSASRINDNPDNVFVEKRGLFSVTSKSLTLEKSNTNLSMQFLTENKEFRGTTTNNMQKGRDDDHIGRQKGEMRIRTDRESLNPSGGMDIIERERESVIHDAEYQMRKPNATRNIGGLEKRKNQELCDDEQDLRKNANDRAIRKGRKRLVTANDNTNAMTSDEEFWNPRKNKVNTIVDSEEDTNISQRIRSNYLSFMERLRASTNSLESEEENTKSNGNYILHSRESSPVISDFVEIMTKNKLLEKRNARKAQRDRNDDNIEIADIEDSFISPHGIRKKRETRKSKDEDLDEEIRNLLKFVGETIFRQFQRQDSALFQATKNAIIQFEHKREWLGTYKRNYVSAMAKLKEGKNELESLEQNLIEMENKYGNKSWIR